MEKTIRRYRFNIEAYNSADVGSSVNSVDNVIISLYAGHEIEALTEAKRIIKKDQFKIKDIEEIIL